MFLNKTGGATAIAGPIVIGDGVGGDALSLLASDQIADTSAMRMAGGIFFAYGNSEVLGTMELTAGSNIDMGVAATGIVQFADSSLVPWTSAVNLVINDWNGNLNGGGAQQLKFDSNNASLTPTQLSQIFFLDPLGQPAGLYPATFSTLNPGEVIPLVPEPASIGLLGAAGLMMLRRRRKI
jgi:hypothetical protein